jgi:hypothetical protein
MNFNSPLPSANNNKIEPSSKKRININGFSKIEFFRTSNLNWNFTLIFFGFSFQMHCNRIAVLVARRYIGLKARWNILESIGTSGPSEIGAKSVIQI